MAGPLGNSSQKPLRYGGHGQQTNHRSWYIVASDINLQVVYTSVNLQQDKG
jgi:hypothetical protein